MLSNDLFILHSLLLSQSVHWSFVSVFCCRFFVVKIKCAISLKMPRTTCYTCNFCGATFKTRRLMNLHKIKDHFLDSFQPQSFQPKPACGKFLDWLPNGSLCNTMRWGLPTLRWYSECFHRNTTPWPRSARPAIKMAPVHHQTKPPPRGGKSWDENDLALHQTKPRPRGGKSCEMT